MCVYVSTAADMYSQISLWFCLSFGKRSSLKQLKDVMDLYVCACAYTLLCVNVCAGVAYVCMPAGLPVNLIHACVEL